MPSLANPKVNNMNSDNIKTNENSYEDGYDIENSIDASTGFIYPSDESNTERNFDVGANDIIIRLSTLLFASPKPKMTLAALLYSSGIDVGIYLNCENTLSAIAKALGESKQNFSATIKRTREEFHLEHCNTGKMEASKDVYSKTNYRKKRNDQ